MTTLRIPAVLVPAVRASAAPIGDSLRSILAHQYLTAALADAAEIEQTTRERLDAERDQAARHRALVDRSANS
jgi:hypothetical protein